MTNIDNILSEWSYRCKKGYPDFTNAEDMAILKQVMAEMNVSFPTEEELLEFDALVDDGLEFLEEDEFYDINKILSEGNFENFILPPKLKQKLIAANKLSEFQTFIEKLPGGESEPAIQDFINRLDTREYDELVKVLYSKTSVEEITKSDYESGAASKLFALEPKGIGKAELFLAWIVANARVSGGGESFDLRVNNKKYEVKDYRRGESKGIRLGTKGKVTRFVFWQEILKTLDTVDNLFATNGVQYIEDESTRNLLTIINDRSEFISKGELNKTDIANFKSLYEKLNKISQSDATGYTYVTFRGPNAEPISYTIKEIPADLKSSVTLDLLSRGVSESLIVQLRKLKYVRQPEAFEVDIQAAVDLAVDPEIPFIIFRPKGPIITTSFELSSISMATIYIIEKK
jgi:predicted transcriptional regulator